MHILHHHSLKPYNTFGIDVTAQYFATFASEEELQELLKHNEIKSGPILILGGGSNLLFTQDYDGAILVNRIKGIRPVPFDEHQVLLEVGAGEGWHDLVLYSIRENLAGLENLSLIPGTVGASPIQNIGAYGVELKDVFFSLRAVHRKTGEVKVFLKEECQFGYRDSIFKREAKDTYVITQVTLILQKQATFNVSYGAIQKTLAEMQIQELSLAAVSEAVCRIRQSKLPDPKIIGNAGSFFKNVEIPKEQYAQLQQEYPAIPGYVVNEAVVKVPAGWLIEQCGWKGKLYGNYGVHKDQALVLVNHGAASGQDLRNLAWEIIDSVETKFGIRLHPEVNII